MYIASRLRESRSGSLSVSSIRHVLGIGRLGSFGGDLGEEGRNLSFLDGGGVNVLKCVWCVDRFVGCVCALVGDVCSRVGKVLFGGGVCLVVVWLFVCVCVYLWFACCAELLVCGVFYVVACVVFPL